MFVIVFFLRYVFGISPSLDRVIVPSRVAVVVEDFLEPLQKLEVILVLAFHEFFHLYILEDAEFGESLL